MSASTGWIRTARRVLPAFFRLSRAIEPTWERDSVRDLDLGFLRANGVSALVWDVDGTLMAHHAHEVDARVRARFEELLAAPDLAHAIVSNCELPRFRELGRLFPDVPVLLGFSTPRGPAYRIRNHGDEAFTGPGADLLDLPGAATPLRKPSAELVTEALRALGVAERPEVAALVGDQHFTDVASANLAGIRSVRVRTLAPSSFPLHIRVSQRLERAWVGLRRALRRDGGPRGAGADADRGQAP